MRYPGSGNTLKYAAQYGVSPNVIGNIGVKRMERMTEDARLVLMNDAKRAQVVQAKSIGRLREFHQRKLSGSVPKKRVVVDSADRLMELAEKVG